MHRQPRVEIVFCTQCRWLLRAAWMAQELLTTFAEELGEAALVPGTGGVFQIRVNDELVWDRAVQGGFPDIKQLKQLVRDRIAPQKDLGHSDAARGSGKD
jgi:selenoprotein W-related protein